MEVLAQLDFEVKKFREFMKSDSIGVYRVSTLGEDVLHLEGPSGSGSSHGAGKSYDVCIMGLVHGNEVAGVAVLNQLLTMAQYGIISADINLVLILGNVPAGHAGKRFLESDLNRSFQSPRTPTSREELRAKELEPILSRSRYLLDIHQTTQPCVHPFFIFPFTQSGFRFARDLAPEHAVVTHWGDPFSTEGRCTDEYVNACGGVGITLELGSCGFDRYQIAAGVTAALWAIRVVAGYVGSSEPVLRTLRAEECGPIYTWARVLPWPATGLVHLEPGLINFGPIASGQFLGMFDGKKVLADVEGWVLFPKYLSEAEQLSLARRPAEFMRLLRQVNLSELAHLGR
jgi:succinylglutamate desuccinylase